MFFTITRNDMAKVKIKKTIGKIHLWLALASGLVVLLLSVTGCIYVFNHEINAYIRKENTYNTTVNHKAIPIQELWYTTQKQVGNEKISSVFIYKDPTKNYVFNCYKQKENSNSIFILKNIDYNTSVYVNPYTGKIIAQYDEKNEFFNIVKLLHWSLLLETEIGQYIVGWSTLIFVIMLLTGIVLWWPKNKAARKQRFKFQWSDTTRWKRKNYDLHNILGFYVASIAIILAFTGMVWAFTWFQGLVYVVASGTITPPESQEMKSIVPQIEISGLNKALNQSKMQQPFAQAFYIEKPKNETASVYITAHHHDGTYYQFDTFQFDQYSGALLNQKRHADKNFGEKVITANYDIHVGAILGLTGKIIAFIVSFICGILPITGFMIWYGRTFKKKNKQKIVMV